MNIKDKITIDAYGTLTHMENFEIVRLFVAERANQPDKNAHEPMFRNHLSKVTDPQYREEFLKYYKASLNAGGLFGKSQRAILEKTLTNLYKLHYTHNTKSKEFADRIVEEKGFKIVINNEARNLLSGSRSYSTEAAAQEAATLRETIQALGKENQFLEKDNKEKGIELEKTNRSLANLMDNVRGLFGIGKENVEKMADKSFKEFTGMSIEEVGKLKIIDRFSVEKFLGDDNYPAGAGEREFKSYDLHQYKGDKFLLKEQVSFYDLDGRSDRQVPKLYLVDRNELKQFTAELRPEREKEVFARIEQSQQSAKQEGKSKSTGIGM